MNALEKCLQDMLDRRPWDYIKANHSQGTVYRSLEKYEPNIEQLYCELSEKIRIIQQENKETEVRFQEAIKAHEEIIAHNQSLLRTRDQINLEIKSSEEKKNTEKEQLQAATSKLEEVQKKLDDLSKLNLTHEKLTEILDSDVASPGDLLERVKTKKEHWALMEQNQRLDESLIEKQKQDQEVASRLEQLQLDVLSEENVFDELKMRNQPWLNGINVANKAQQLGYTPDIMVQILDALFKLGVKDEPVRSARRLLRRFEKIREEIELDESITRKTAALESLESRYNEVSGALQAVKKDALTGIKMVEKTAVERIASVEVAAKSKIGTVADQSYRSIRSTEQSAVESVEKVMKSSGAAMSHLKNDVSKVFMDNSFALQLAIETYKRQVSDWGDVREQVGMYTELIKLATILLGIQQNPDALLGIEPAVITRLAERINLYIERKWPGFKTKASIKISSKDWGISSFYEAELSSVSSWLVEALKHLERRGSQ